MSTAVTAPHATKRPFDALASPVTPLQKRPRTFWDTVLGLDTPTKSEPQQSQRYTVIPSINTPERLPDVNAVTSPVSNFTDPNLNIPSPTPSNISPRQTIHKSPKPHTCPTCGSSFARSSHLRLHIRTIHEKLKPFQCEQCPAAFGHVSSKYRHFRTVHLKRRDFACDRCGQTFAERSAVLKHCRTVHEGSRPYPCPTCGFRFHFKLHLSQHISTVHEKQRPHQCNICNACFGQRSSLNRHSRQIHGVSTKK